MRSLIIAVVSILLVPLASTAGERQKLYRWVDADGIVHYGDSVPAEFADSEKRVLNEHGVTVGVMHGRKTAEEIAEENRLAELKRQAELQRRADEALLATYLSVDEIIMHRDRRVELFKAQSRVTELYLRNMMRRMTELREEALKYRPYSEDPDAEMIDPELAEDILVTKSTIKKHQTNLQRFREAEQNIVARFDGDINRFKTLKNPN
ncbi:MAG: DUF4124 domain-containing protein [Woeseia sp.]